MVDKLYVINEIAASESWRMFHIMAEFVEGFEALGKYHPSVSIFGSTRVKPGGEVYQKAEQIGRVLAENGFGVITGGGPGVMEGANKGAASAGGNSIGLNIFGTESSIGRIFHLKFDQLLSGDDRQLLQVLYRLYFQRIDVSFIKHLFYPKRFFISQTNHLS